MKPFFIAKLLAIGLGIGISQTASADWESEGAAAMKTGQYEKAIAIYRQTLDDNPFNAIAANNIGVALSMKRQYPEALTWLDKASRMDKRRKDIELNKDTLATWLETHNHLVTGDTPMPAAISGPLSPEPPALW